MDDTSCINDKSTDGAALYGWFPLCMEAKRKISTENLIDSAGAMHDKGLE